MNPAADHHLAPLFFALLGVCFLYGALNVGVQWDLWHGVLMTALVGAGGYTLRGLGAGPRQVAALVLPVLLVVWGEEAVASPGLFIARHVAAAIFELVLAARLLAAASRASRVDMGLVLGTASTYLLIGLISTHAFLVLNLVDPGCVRGNLTHDPMATLTFYSFSALTTLGADDLSPVSPLARSLSVGEALCGNLFLAIVVARVVSMHVADRGTPVN